MLGIISQIITIKITKQVIVLKMWTEMLKTKQPPPTPRPAKWSPIYL